ncbi:uncharacterized protein METZ01_LOCUS234653 [marine metagenome]|uniref:Uncharacterized protein n=1 Tax=marine metagenome TaxID=408172 RepID=A0A382H3N6_9ZZZZ
MSSLADIVTPYKEKQKPFIKLAL